jgi:polyphosphate kinase 2 (PPK2 family)
MDKRTPSPTFPQLTEEFPPSRFEQKAQYKDALKRCQKTLLHVQQAYYHQNRRALIVFEGWDAGGKGGTIRRLTERLDPRGVNVYPIAAPSDEEQGKHFLYRFWRKIPSPGTFAIFDRSHYGRVLVERIDKLATQKEWHRAYREINEFERTLNDDGVRIIKIFMHISKEEQRRRFEERLHNPYKRWKLTKEDLHNRAQRGEYLNAINDMFRHTHTSFAPWKVIDGEHKWQARVDTLEYITSMLSKGVEIAPPPLDESLIEMAASQLDIDEHAIRK